MNKRKLKIFITVIIMVGAVSYIVFSSMGQGSVYYYKVSEVENLTNKQIQRRCRIAGKLNKQSVKYDEKLGKLTFIIFEGNEKIKIHYNGVIPDTLFKGTEVIAEGKFQDKQNFSADSIITKCPSKYEAQGKEHPSAEKK